MNLRRPLLGVILLAMALHAAGMALNPLPAQDGLKFIRIAREFGRFPWADVVRRSDQHPLYPALIALAHPPVEAVMGDGPASWRVAAQGVSVAAMVLLLVPLHRFVRLFFDERAADLAALLFVLLPIPARLGHETLSDATALLCFAWGLAWGAEAMKTARIAPAIGAGTATGLGFLTRPEIALLPAMIVIVARAWAIAGRQGPAGSPTPRGHMSMALAVSLPFAVLVCSYASIKGELSEKLAMRQTAGIGDGLDVVRDVPQWLPPGLDDPRWDFSPKEESGDPARLGFASATCLAARCIGEAMAWVLVPLTVLGMRRARASRGSGPLRWLASAYAVVFGAVVVRHAMLFGYLSSRHTLTLVLVAMPWASAGAIRLGEGLADRFAWPEGRRRRLASLAIGSAVVAAAIVQLEPGHPSRWGHAEAGRWLAEHAGTGDAVLDTRGWAAFVSDVRSYDPWHIRQALTDATLAFVVVGDDELRADSRRAETLKAVLDYAATPVASFPERRGGRGTGVWVYRFERPESWEAIAR